MRVTAAAMSRKGAVTLVFRDGCEDAMMEKMSRPYMLQKSCALSSRYEGKGNRDVRMLGSGSYEIWRQQPLNSIALASRASTVLGINRPRCRKLGIGYVESHNAARFLCTSEPSRCAADRSRSSGAGRAIAKNGLLRLYRQAQ